MDIWTSAATGRDPAALVGYLKGGGDPNAQNHGRSLLYIAAGSGQCELVKALLDHGADPNSADSLNRQCALHLAAWMRDVCAARALILAGAQVDPRDMFGNTPLFYAVGFHAPADLELVRLLLTNGAAANSTNNYKVQILARVQASGPADVRAVFEELGLFGS